VKLYPATYYVFDVLTRNGATDLEADLKVFLETEGKGQFCIDPKVLPKEEVITLKSEGDQVMVSGVSWFSPTSR
jgi:hypothetical protein